MKYKSIYCLKTMKMAIFHQKMAKKGPKWPEFPFFYMDPMLPWLRSIQLIGMRLFFRVKEVRVDLLPQNHENGHFQQQKMAKKWP